MFRVNNLENVSPMNAIVLSGLIGYAEDKENKEIYLSAENRYFRIGQEYLDEGNYTKKIKSIGERYTIGKIIVFEINDNPNKFFFVAYSQTKNTIKGKPELKPFLIFTRQNTGVDTKGHSRFNTEVSFLWKKGSFHPKRGQEYVSDYGVITEETLAIANHKQKVLDTPIRCSTYEQKFEQLIGVVSKMDYLPEKYIDGLSSVIGDIPAEKTNKEYLLFKLNRYKNSSRNLIFSGNFYKEFEIIVDNIKKYYREAA